MKKIVMQSLFFLFSISASLCAQDIQGFWKCVNEKTGHAECMIAVYEYQNRYYGRIILTYDDNGHIVDSVQSPITRAPGVVGNPFYSGMDIIWNLQKKGTKYTNGNIIDPEHGRVYGAELWVNNGSLIVRGKILFFGRNQTWPPAEDADFPPNFQKPDLATLVPVIPRVS